MVSTTPCVCCDNENFSVYHKHGLRFYLNLRAIIKFLLRLVDSLIPRSLGFLKSLSSRKDYLFQGKIVVCNRCGHGQLRKMPSPDAVLAYYSNEYWTRRKVVPVASNQSDYKNDERAARQLDFVLEFLEGRSAENYLEIGAGRALALQLIRANIPNCNIYACEPGMEWEQYYSERKIERIAKFFPFETTMKFNYIHTSHWLEHVLDLQDIISNIHHLLPKDGLFFVEVPNTGHDYWEMPENRSISPHIHFFTKLSLTTIMERSSFACLNIGEFGISVRDYYSGKKIEQGPGGKGMYIRALFRKT